MLTRWKKNPIKNPLFLYPLYASPHKFQNNGRQQLRLPVAALWPPKANHKHRNIWQYRQYMQSALSRIDEEVHRMNGEPSIEPNRWCGSGLVGERASIVRYALICSQRSRPWVAHKPEKLIFSALFRFPENWCLWTNFTNYYCWP